MTERKPIPAKDIPDFIRSGRHLSPALQRMLDENRRQIEAHRTVFRDIIDGFHKQMATALKLDVRSFARVPDDVIDRLIADGVEARSLIDLPGTKINVSFTSEVTVNGVRLPDEGKE
jgi:hypothetical protein